MKSAVHTAMSVEEMLLLIRGEERRGGKEKSRLEQMKKTSIGSGLENDPIL